MECVSDIEHGKRGRAEGCGMKRGRKYVLFFIHVVIWPKSIHHYLRLQSGTHAAFPPNFSMPHSSMTGSFRLSRASSGFSGKR